MLLTADTSCVPLCIFATAKCSFLTTLVSSAHTFLAAPHIVFGVFLSDYFFVTLLGLDAF